MKYLKLEFLEDEDFSFIKKFILNSGSLKHLAKEYNISYPTVRLRLDRLIQKIKIYDEHTGEDDYIKKIKLLATNGEISVQTAKTLINDYQKQIERIKS